MAENLKKNSRLKLKLTFLQTVVCLLLPAAVIQVIVPFKNCSVVSNQQILFF